LRANTDGREDSSTPLSSLPCFAHELNKEKSATA